MRTAASATGPVGQQSLCPIPRTGQLMTEGCVSLMSPPLTLLITQTVSCVCVCVYVHYKFAESVYVQVQTDISVDTKQQTLQGVAFPLHGEAMQALQKFKDKKFNYVQLVSTLHWSWLWLKCSIFTAYSQKVSVCTVLSGAARNWCSHFLEHHCNTIDSCSAGLDVEDNDWNKISTLDL